MKLVELTNHKLVGIENPGLNFDTLFVKIDLKFTELLALEDTIPWSAETRRFGVYLLNVRSREL